jgi:hypothetical protein
MLLLCAWRRGARVRAVPLGPGPPSSGVAVVRVGVTLLVFEAVEDDAEHAGAHVLERAEAIGELLPVLCVGPGDNQCATGHLRKDRGVGHRE